MRYASMTMTPDTIHLIDDIEFRDLKVQGIINAEHTEAEYNKQVKDAEAAREKAAQDAAERADQDQGLPAGNAEAEVHIFREDGTEVGVDEPVGPAPYYIEQAPAKEEKKEVHEAFAKRMRVPVEEGTLKDDLVKAIRDNALEPATQQDPQ